MNWFRKPRPWRSVEALPAQRPLRCLFVITSMPVGGAETLLVNMIRRFESSRIQAEIVCLKQRGPLGEQLADQIPVHANLISHKWDLRVLLKLIRLFRRRRTDVVITVGAGDKMFWGRLAAWIAGVPVIASALHSTGWPDGVGRLNRLLSPITDAWIAVADSHGKFLSEWEGFPADRIRVVRNGVDCSVFHPDASQRASVRKEIGIPVDADLIGIVAALRQEKNHLAFVQTAARLRDRYPDTHWLIVGDGPERATIEADIAKRGMGDRIHLLGTRQDTPRLLAALDVFTLCSHNEAFPVSILEALACGIPVVATNVGSVSESVRDSKTGHLVEPDDIHGLANAVARLLDDPENRTRLGENGRRLVQQSGSLDAMVGGYERLAEEIYQEKAIPSDKRPAEATSGFEPLKN